MDTTCIPALQLFVKELAKHVDVSIVSLHYPYNEHSYDWNGIKVRALGGKNNRLIRKFQLKSKLFRVLAQIQTQNSIDVLHSFWLTDATYFTSKFAQKNNLNHIVTTMGQDVLSTNRWLKKMAFNAFQLVTISEIQTIELAKSGHQSKRVIPFGIIPIEQQEKSIDIIGVGNLIPLKNYNYFVELIAEVRGEHPNLKAVLIGDGPLRGALQTKIEQLGLSDTIELLGKQDYSRTQSYIAKAKVLVHPARYEGFGMIFIEAKAAQTHILSQQVGLMYNQPTEFLTLDLKNDAVTLKKLLNAGLPPLDVYAVSSAVNQYLEMY